MDILFAWLNITPQKIRVTIYRYMYYETNKNEYLFCKRISTLQQYSFTYIKIMLDMIDETCICSPN